MAYCEELPQKLKDVCKETLTRINKDWLLQNLFNLIWTLLREEPEGDASQWPTWPLKVNEKRQNSIDFFDNSDDAGASCGNRRGVV